MIHKFKGRTQLTIWNDKIHLCASKKRVQLVNILSHIWNSKDKELVLEIVLEESEMIPYAYRTKLVSYALKCSNNGVVKNPGV